MPKIIEGLTFDDVLLKPKYSEIKSRSDTDVSTDLVPRIRLDIPILSANMDTVTTAPLATVMAMAGGIGIIHRFMTIEQEAEEVRLVASKGLKVGAAVGVAEEDNERVERCIEAGATVIVVDVAHAHSKNVADAMSRYGNWRCKVPFIGGNVATSEGAKFLIDLGFLGIKVGVGNGAVCLTRSVTSFGVPQLSAIMDCADVCDINNVTLISDGGIRTSGDIVKAIAAGADSVMIGSMFAGTEESPGSRIVRNGTVWKEVRGMASLSANIDRKKLNSTVTNEYISSITPEGVEAKVPYTGPVNSLLGQLVGGIRSGLSYAGARTIKDLQNNVVFIKMTSAGLRESNVHDVYL